MRFHDPLEERGETIASSSMTVSQASTGKEVLKAQQGRRQFEPMHWLGWADAVIATEHQVDSRQLRSKREQGVRGHCVELAEISQACS